MGFLVRVGRCRQMVFVWGDGHCINAEVCHCFRRCQPDDATHRRSSGEGVSGGGRSFSICFIFSFFVRQQRWVSCMCVGRCGQMVFVGEIKGRGVGHTTYSPQIRFNSRYMVK